MLLFEGTVAAVNRLTGELVYEEELATHKYGSCVAVAGDRMQGTLWLCSERNVFELVVTDEARDDPLPAQFRPASASSSAAWARSSFSDRPASASSLGSPLNLERAPVCGSN